MASKLSSSSITNSKTVAVNFSKSKIKGEKHKGKDHCNFYFLLNTCSTTVRDRGNSKSCEDVPEIKAHLGFK